MRQLECWYEERKCLGGGRVEGVNGGERGERERARR